MPTLSEIAKMAERTIRKNSTTILSALGISGVITTSYLVGKATFEATHLIIDDEIDGSFSDDPKQRFKDRSQLVWKLYIPASISGTATIACIIGATKVGNRKTAAAQAAFTLTERAFSEYRDKVVEQFGENKERAIRDEIAQDRVDRNKPPSQEVLITGPGNVLCYEAFTGRYFTSDMETLRKAQNDLNAKLVAHMYAYLSDFYYMIGIPMTSYSGNIGWESDRMMELIFSTTLTEDGRPCLSFDYNYTKPI